MAKSFKQKLAKRFSLKFFSQAKTAGIPDKSVAAAARKVLSGKGSDADAETVLGFYGVRTSGATQAARGYKKFRQGFDEISRDVQLLAQATETGSGATVAQERLISNLNEKVQNLISSKWARTTAEKAVQFIGYHPVVANRMLYALGRFLRVGGVVASIGMAGVAVGQTLLSGRARGAKAQTDRRDLVREFTSDPTLVRDLQREAERNVKAQKHVDDKTVDRLFNALFGETGAFEPDGLRALMKDYLDAEAQEEIKAEVQRGLSARKAARGAVGEFGIDRNSVLARFASKRGKTISELTERDQAEALDAAINEAIPSVDQLLSNPESRSKIEAEIEREGAAANTLRVSPTRYRRQVAERFRDKIITDTAGRAEERRLRAEEIRRQRELNDPGWGYRNAVQIQTINALWNNVLTRHQSVYTD
ncbi:MAG: hypothetical protein L6R28_06635 [Planctomycetes bacterium]|nr:hypothetical protein [Planctomycetota bacterium]